MILYFADRKMNILGQASTSLPEGVTQLQLCLVDHGLPRHLRGSTVNTCGAEQ